MAYRLEKTSSGADIVVDGFEAGIADSPYDGISDMRNINITSVPKEAAVNFKTQAIQQTSITTAAFTVAASNDTFTYSGTQLKVGTTIVLNTLTGGTGLALATNYWVKSIPTSTTFTVTAAAPGVAGSVGGATVNITLDGSGTFSTVNMTLLNQIVPNTSNSAYYGVDTNGRVWIYALSASSTNWIYLGNTATAAFTPDYATGIAYWNGYIILLYDGASGYGLYTGSGTPAAFTFFKALSVGNTNHRTYTDKNDTLYWCDGPAIGSLIELTTFNPATPATYTWSQQALLIQANDIAQCMTQLGTNLLVGGVYNQVYSWDRFSTGYLPIFLPENNTQRMVTINSNAYVFAGNRGNIYICNGANAQSFKKLPDHLSGTVRPSFTWGGAAVNENQLYFSATANTYSLPLTYLPYYGGVWAIDMDTGALRMINQLSYGTYNGYVAEITATSSSNTGLPGLDYASNFGFICSWADGTSGTIVYGSDATKITAVPALTTDPYTNYESYVDSDMIPVGTYLNPTTDANVEFKLTVPMVSGEGVKLAYRQDLSQSFTDITNGEFTTAGVFSGVVKVNFQKSQWLQIRTYTKSTATTPSYTRLKELRIRQ